MKKNNYDDRYGENWYAIRKQALRLTFGRCSVLPLLKAKEVHHLYYSTFLLGKITDRYEIPLWNVIPVSKFVHEILHKSTFWHTNKKDRVWGNRQKLIVIWILRIWLWTWLLPLQLIAILLNLIK
jgi:hypothetical protein